MAEKNLMQFNGRKTYCTSKIKRDERNKKKKETAISRHKYFPQ